MATIAEVLSKAILSTFPLPEWEGREPLRPLYVRPGLFDEIDSDPRFHVESAKLGGRSASEQIDQMFCDFRCAVRPSAGDLRRMVPNHMGIRKLHPRGSRVYGWSPARGLFVAVTVALEIDTKVDHKLNDAKMYEVLAFIEQYGLNDSVFLGDHNALFPA